MDPIQQILAQGQMGDKNGGLQQYYFEGQRAGQQQQQINLSKQRLMLEQQHQDKEDALMPYRIEAMKLSNRNQALAIDADVMKLRVMTQQNEALPQVLQLQSEYLASPLGARDPSLFQKSQELSQKYPFAFTPNTPGGAIMDSLKAEVMVQKQWQTIGQAQKALEGTGQYLKEINPKTGAITLGADAVDKLPATAIQIAEKTAKLQSQLRKTTDPELKLDLANQIKSLDDQSQASQFEVQIDPETGKPTRIGYGRGAATQGAPTVAQANKAEDAATAASNAATSALDVIRYAETGNVGFIGNINRLASTLGGQVADIKPGTEFKYAQATDFLKAAAVKVLRSDGNISEAERKQVIANLPNTSVNESPATAREKALNISHIMAESARRQVLRAGRPLPPELMTEVEIRNSMDRGDITREQAKDLLMKAPLSPFFGGPQ